MHLQYPVQPNRKRDPVHSPLLISPKNQCFGFRFLSFSSSETKSKGNLIFVKYREEERRLLTSGRHRSAQLPSSVISVFFFETHPSIIEEGIPKLARAPETVENPMDSLGPNQFDIFEIYRRFSELRTGNAYFHGEDGHRQDEGLQRAKYSRDGLNQLLKMVESRMHTRTVIFDELHKLMLQLDLTADFSEFSCFYDFVFFMCRENGQKNITVSRAVAAWRLVLAGRFRLHDKWCKYVEENQRHNISEDTWQQVLAFSRCVHENLEGYDPEGAWPVLIDDFVEHMYRISGSNKDSNVFCCCVDLESQSSEYEDTLPGLRVYPGMKRKLPECHGDEMESLDSHFLNSPDPNCSLNSKRSRLIARQSVNREDNPPQSSSDDCMEIAKHSSPMCSSKSPCSIEGCLSKGFAGLLSSCSSFAV